MRRQLIGWIGTVPLLVVGMLFTACNGPAATSSKELPATIEKIEGTDFSRITLTEKAAQRLALETVPVKLETVVRMRRVGGEVMAVRAASGSTGNLARVKVSLNRSDLVKVNRGQQARVVEMGLDDGEDSDGDAAEFAEAFDKGQDPILVAVHRQIWQSQIGRRTARVCRVAPERQSQTQHRAVQRRDL
jgi:hypothetical protein